MNRMMTLTSLIMKSIARNLRQGLLRQRRGLMTVTLAAAISLAIVAMTSVSVLGGSANFPAASENPVENWSRLTYSSDRDNNWDVYTAQGDGSDETRLTFRSATDSTPKLNRGATRIVFASDATHATGVSEIYTINVDGSGETRLTFTGKGEYLPAWSPDGSKIVFASARDGNLEIYVMNADGSAQTRLTNNPAWDADPAWSPDGRQIVFVSNRAGQNLYQLWIMNADGTNPMVVSAALNYALYPAWSPDGSRIAFNDNQNNDKTLDIAIINRDGTGLVHPLGYAPTQTDYRAPVWSPDGKQLAFAMIHRISYNSTDWDQANLYALTLANNSLRQMTPGNADWWVYWETTDVTPPSSTVTTPALAASPTFTVTWSGVDTQSGVKDYDLQVRDGAGGSWTPWLTATTQTSAVFNGELAHTYYFQSRATDWAGNVGAYPGGNGSTMTSTPQYALSGWVRGLRDQPVAVAQIEPGPPVLGPAQSDAGGGFKLYYNLTGTTTLTATRTGFGNLPAMRNVTLSAASPQPAFYLPPLNDAVTNGQFENGNLGGWNVTGEVTPTMTTTAHTGMYGAQLGGDSGASTTSAPVHSVLSQKLTMPDSITATLSLLYRTAAMNPLSSTFSVYLYGPAETLTMTAPLTGTEWQHVWWDIPASFAPVLTVSLDLNTTGPAAANVVAVDEVSLGPAVVGSYPIFLPLTMR